MRPGWQKSLGCPTSLLYKRKTKTHSCLTHWFSVVGLPLHVVKFAKKTKTKIKTKTPLAKLFCWTGTMKWAFISCILSDVRIPCPYRENTCRLMALPHQHRVLINYIIKTLWAYSRVLVCCLHCPGKEILEKCIKQHLSTSVKYRSPSGWVSQMKVFSISVPWFPQVASEMAAPASKVIVPIKWGDACPIASPAPETVNIY